MSDHVRGHTDKGQRSADARAGQSDPVRAPSSADAPTSNAPASDTNPLPPSGGAGEWIGRAEFSPGLRPADARAVHSEFDPSVGRANARAGQSDPVQAPSGPPVDEEPVRPASAARNGGGAPVDTARAEAAVRELLIAIGEDPERDGLKDTPSRVARAYEEFFAGLTQTPEDVLSAVFELGHEEMILVKDIELYSMCEHHLVPFHGVAHVAYIPGEDGRITGLSKLARLVEIYARRPQVQERLTTQVADALVDHLGARGVIVVVEAEHLCMSMRGIRKPGSRTVTSAVRGVMRDGATRAEAMSLIVGK